MKVKELFTAKTLICALVLFIAFAMIFSNFSGLEVNQNAQSHSSTGKLGVNSLLPVPFKANQSAKKSAGVITDVIKNVQSPFTSVYVPFKDELYVTSVYSDQLTIINTTTQAVAGSLNMNQTQNGIIFDPVNSLVYVAGGNGVVSAINPSNNSFVANVSVGSNPGGLTLDTANGMIYVDCGPSNTVFVINTSTQEVVSTFVLSDFPAFPVYVPTTGDIYTGYVNSNNVSVIDPTTQAILYNVTVGPSPEGILYDPANNLVYADIFGGSDVSVINVTTGTVTASVNVSEGPALPGLDSSNGLLYVTDSASNQVSVINTSSNSVQETLDVAIYPTSATYDSANGNVYVTDAYSNEITVISTSNITYYNVTFHENGLPTGTQWQVTANSSLNEFSNSSATPTISFSVLNGTYTYYAKSLTNGYDNLVSDNEIVVSGAGITVNLTFIPGPYTADAVSYNYANSTSLQPGASDYLYAFSTSGTAQATPFVNGSYASANSSSGYVVAGIAQSKSNINSFNSSTNSHYSISGVAVYNYSHFQEYYTKLTPPVQPVTYLNYSFELSADSLVVFVGASGGAYYLNFSGINGIVTDNGTNYPGDTGTLISQAFLAPGNYTIRMESTNFDTGSQTRADILGVFVYSEETVPEYSVGFNERGLPQGTAWGVTFNGELKSSAGTSVSFSTPAGTYGYRISSVPGYYVQADFGNLTVSNRSVEINITYLKYSTLSVSVRPQEANLTINGMAETLVAGNFSAQMKGGDYFLNVSLAGYLPFSEIVFLKPGNTTDVQISLEHETKYGYLSGQVVPGNATIVADGIVIPVVGGHFNQSLTPGQYYVSFTAGGYDPIVEVINLTANTTVYLNVQLNKTLTSTTLYGYVNPVNASLLVDGDMAYVDSNGYYSITMPVGTYTISVDSPGYFPYSVNLSLNSSREVNFTLQKEPAATSTLSLKNTTVSGYNVTVSNITSAKGVINVTYSSTINGTLVVSVPFSDLENATLAEILNSTVYINGNPYHNFSITITSDYTVILKVYNLSAGDPVLYWKYSSAGVVPPPQNSSPLKLGTYGYIAIAVVIVVAGAAIYAARRKRK